MMAQSELEQESFQDLLEGLRERSTRSDSLEKMRQKFWQRFLEMGLPTRQDEAYRYIKLRQLFSHQYTIGSDKNLQQNQILPWVYPECQRSFIVFVNGNYSASLSNLDALPSKVVVSSLQEAVNTYGTLLNNMSARSLKEETDCFAVINGALHGRGAFIYVPPETKIESPIQILHLLASDHPHEMMIPRLQVFIGCQSEVNIICSQKNLTESTYFVNQVTELILDDRSHLRFTQVYCGEYSQSWHLDAVRATLKSNCTLKSVCVTEGSATVRTDYRVSLMGENAEAELNGISMLSSKSESHAHVFMDHQAPHCRSHQLFKNVLNDFSRSSFEGKIMVRQPAQKTEAFQLNNNLILSDHAHADSKPNLEIFADDVKASHGATVGQLDAEQLFYMKTRGFSDKAAKNLLVFGFCEQVIGMIPVLSPREEISSKARYYNK